tara:strand:+ start:2085 stop:2576 length:492 start_codon:yes stop_codon:yes gene_type:complete
MNPSIKIGYGYDVHQLAPQVALWLGGIKIPHTHGAIGHSDADVLIHVICDALLGAANLGDIGFHFSDKDPKYKDIDSKILLKEVLALIDKKKFKIGNIDTTICLQEPKIRPYIEDIKTCLSGLTGLDTENISIKATTTETLGFVGKKEGISAHAVVLIYKEEK